MAIDFPTLSRGISSTFTEKPSDAADSADIRTQSDAGYVITRRRFTRVPKVFSGTYAGLNNADYATLTAFIDQVGTSGNFNWTHPQTAVVHDVRFLARPPLRHAGQFWSAEVELEEV